MAYLLTDLVVDRVDLVDAGANSAASIELFKRKEQEPMDFTEVISKMAPEQGSLIQAELDRLSGELTKAKDNLTTMTADCTKAKEQCKTAEDECDALKEENKKTAKVAFDEEETIKSMPKEVRSIFTKMKAQKEAAEAEVLKAKDAEAHAEAASKAAVLKSLPVEQEKLTALLKSAKPELFDVLSTIAAAMDETVLGEVGKAKYSSGKASTSNEAWAKIEEKANEVAKKDSISKAKAISKVVNENSDLYKQYLQGGAN